MFTFTHKLKSKLDPFLTFLLSLFYVFADQLTFEGLWSPLTHPKDFPADAWSAHFSDIVGASHAPHFRFWKKDGMASEGVKQMAETGDSKDLESELKAEV